MRECSAVAARLRNAPGPTDAAEDRSLLREPALLWRVWLALAVANARFWPTIAGPARAQLRRWRDEAQRIEEPSTRSLAVEKLCSERFNAEVAGTLATLAPRRTRATVIEAIVALEVLFDYLDGLTERLGDDQLDEARRILAPLRDAVARRDLLPNRRGDEKAGTDRSYIDALASAVTSALQRLPASSVVSPQLQRTAERCIEGQARLHAAPHLGDDGRAWAEAQIGKEGTAGEERAGRGARARRAGRTGTGLQWREYLAASASSVLAMHALIAAAADPSTTAADAAELDELYLRIAVMSTTLDSTVDLLEDLDSGAPSHVARYEDPKVLAEMLVGVAEDVARRCAASSRGPHHIMMLTGVIAYYLSSPKADHPFAAAVAERLRARIGLALAPALGVMRAWRLAKRIRRIAVAPVCRPMLRRAAAGSSRDACGSVRARIGPGR